MKSFDQKVDERVSANGRNAPLAATAREFTAASALAKYSYNFSTAHGGSLVFSASMLELNAAGGGAADGRVDHKLLVSVAPSGYLKRVR